MDALIFKEISTRAKVAYALRGLESALQHYGFNWVEWNLLLDSLWKFCTDRMPHAVEDSVELLPGGVLEDIPYNISSYKGNRSISCYRRERVGERDCKG